MIINVGSENRVKRIAVEEVCREMFGSVTLNCYPIDSGVSHTPTTDEEIIRGAVNRAREAYGKSRADLGIGLEGGIASSLYGPILKGWAAVFDGCKTFIGSTPGMPFPAHLMHKIEGQKELAHVMDELSGQRDVRSKQGAFGILTRNRITRKETFKLSLFCALAPIVNKEMYKINS
jgi:inosine/xanthosine triphosphatase